MKSSVRPGRVLTAAALTTLAFAATACGTNASPGSPGSTVTVTQTAGGTPAGTPASTPTAAPTATAPPQPGLCATSGLKVAVGGSNGAAGTIYYTLRFTNTSGSTCTLTGYPGVSLVSAGNDSGSQIGSDAKRDLSAVAHLVVLSPGDAAFAVLAIVDAGVLPSCHIVTAHWLKIFPPNQTAAAYVAFTTQTCSQTTTPTMRIAPVRG